MSSLVRRAQELQPEFAVVRVTHLSMAYIALDNERSADPPGHSTAASSAEREAAAARDRDNADSWGHAERVVSAVDFSEWDRSDLRDGESSMLIRLIARSQK